MTTKMVFHGSDIEKICDYYHLNKEDIVKFGANVNPLGLSASVKKEIAENVDLFSSYPDRDYVSPKDLAGRGLILTRRDLIKKEIVNWFGAYGAAFHVVASGNLPYNLAAMCRKNMGIFLNLKLDCSYEGLKYIPLLPKLESRTVLVWKKNQTMSPTVRAFIKFAQQFMKNLKNEN